MRSLDLSNLGGSTGKITAVNQLVWLIPIQTDHYSYPRASKTGSRNMCLTEAAQILLYMFNFKKASERAGTRVLSLSCRCVRLAGFLLIFLTILATQLKAAQGSRLVALNLLQNLSLKSLCSRITLLSEPSLPVLCHVLCGANQMRQIR